MVSLSNHEENVMAKTIMIECPHCGTRFTLHYEDFYGKKDACPVCPKCKKSFRQEESPWVWI